MKPGKDFIGVGVGAFILNDRNEVLMLLRSKNCKNEAGKWMIPGGSVDFNERLEDCAMREVKEEIGVDVEVIGLIAAVNHILPEENQHWVAPTFKCIIKSGEPKILEPEKHDELKWFPLGSMPENLSIATTRVMEAYRQRQGK